jgi:hypothetical protein
LEKGSKPLAACNMKLLGLRRQFASRHIIDHALTKGLIVRILMENSFPDEVETSISGWSYFVVSRVLPGHLGGIAEPAGNIAIAI